VAFAIRKLAWEDCSGMYEFGMFEGGMFHDMWDRGWINLIIPTPPMLHGHTLGATFHMDNTLHTRLQDHPEKVAGKHELGEERYERLRGRRYHSDYEYITAKYIDPFRGQILSLLKYNFNPMDF